MTQAPAQEMVRLPQVMQTADGKVRQVGIEIEFCGLPLEAIVTCIQSVVGGHAELTSTYETTIRESQVGDITVAFDIALFRELKLRHFFDRHPFKMLGDDFGRDLEAMMAGEASRFVPYEVVFSPVEIPRLVEVDAVRAALCPHAEGTGESVFNAFGLHLNVEMPSLDVGSILRYLRAFLVQYEHLKRAHDVDVTRRMTPFINAFSMSYAVRVLQRDYAPDLTDFIRDYIRDNPTRNRPLDLLPLLAWVDETLVRSFLPEEKIGKRPALHYRMPNSLINDPQWNIVLEWNHWVRVEQLASDDEALARAARSQLRQLQGPVRYWFRRLWRRLRK